MTEERDWSASGYAAHGAFVPALGAAVVDLLSPRAGERILDLGCGDGVLTAELVARGAVVVGVDASAEMVAATRARGLDARLVDAQRLDFSAQFDAVFSNAALHWMSDQPSVVRGVFRALVPAGRFVGELGGFGNVAAVQVALDAVLIRHGLDPARMRIWTFPTAEQWRGILVEAGFLVSDCVLFPRPTLLSTDMAGWLDTFAARILAQVPPSLRQRIRDECVALLMPALLRPDGRWSSDYVRLRFRAEKPIGPGAPG